MDDDYLYIENHRYLKEAFIVLPLEGTRIAILSPRRDLFKVVGSWEEAKLIGPLAEGHGRSKTDIELSSGPSIKLEIKL